MGFRTVVMLSNDHAHEWERDTELGRKIGRAMSYASSPDRRDLASVGGYGQVVECVHADQQTLAIFDGYTAFKHIDAQPWARGPANDEAIIRLLKSAANKLGYRLVKKPA